MIRESRLAGPVALSLGSIAAVCVAVAGPSSGPAPSAGVGAAAQTVTLAPARAGGLDARSPSAPRFLAADSLDADHPLMRLRELNRLRGAIDDEAQEVSRRQEEIARSIRDVREEAKAARKELHAACVAEAEQFLNERRQALYARVDEAFDKARAEPIHALTLDLEDSLPSARVAALDESIHTLAHVLEDDLAERLGCNHEPSVRRLRSLGSDLSSRVHGRIQDSWESVGKRHEHHAEEFGPVQAGRAQWVEQQLEALRTEVRERIDCAVERSLETYSGQLRKRLTSMDIPHSDEVLATLTDVSGQLDAWTMGFVRGSANALGTYVVDVRPSREALPVSLSTHLESGEAGQAALQKVVDAVLAERFVLPTESGATSPDWRTADAARTFIEDLRTRLGRAVNDGRNDLRPDALAIERLLSDEERRSDEAWSDLRSALKRLKSRAANDCWKLDGPHLDGRFIPKLKDKFAMAD